MNPVEVVNIKIVNNPDLFTKPIFVNITISCKMLLSEDVDFAVIYVGSSKDESKDQILESFSLKPTEVGLMEFQIEIPPPNPAKIPTKGDLLGVTAIIFSLSYMT